MVYFRIVTSSDYDWMEFQASLWTEFSIISNNKIDKIQKGEISWRMCYDNMQKNKLVQGNKNCCARIIDVRTKYLYFCYLLFCFNLIP